MPRDSLLLGARKDALSRLATALANLADRGRVSPDQKGARQDSPGGGAVHTGWPGIDALGGLSRGLLHEWFGVADPCAKPRAPWTPPLRILAALADRARGNAGGGKWVCWIGPRVWPYPRALIPREQLPLIGSEPTPKEGDRPQADWTSGGLLASSLFVDPPDDAVRLWAVDLAVRCPALAAVVADARGLTMAASRRLQLAAEKSARDGGPLVLLARPLAERAVLSVAGTRWLVERATGPASEANPSWNVEVLRWKDRIGVSAIGRRWGLEWRHAESDVVESSVVVDGSSESKPASACRSPELGSPEFREPSRGIAAV